MISAARGSCRIGDRGILGGAVAIAAPERPAAAPVVVSADPMSTDAPGDVVPVTVVVADPIVAPEAGSVRVTVCVPGAP